MTETIRLISHPGARAVRGFDQTLTLVDPQELTPAFDIIQEGQPRRYFSRGESVVCLRPALTLLGDAELAQEGQTTVIHFDGEMSMNGFGCRRITPSFTRIEGEIMHLSPDTRTSLLLVEEVPGTLGLTGYLPNTGRLVHVGHEENPLTWRRERGLLDVRLPHRTLAEGRELLERAGIEVILHDPRFGDLDAHLRRLRERGVAALASVAERMADSAEGIRRFLAGEARPLAWLNLSHLERDLDQVEALNAYLPRRPRMTTRRDETRRGEADEGTPVPPLPEESHE